MRPNKTENAYPFQKNINQDPNKQNQYQNKPPDNSQMNSFMVQRMIQKPNKNFRAMSPLNNEPIKRNSIFKDSVNSNSNTSPLNLNFMKGQSTLDKLTK
jgi:hypothetical protein